uniref:Photosystem II reaction center protein J n=1 Tax=Nephroselmis olivacea TaxID=31312 RepID=PSBJ_NEPOL|nr:photosystem II protein J [Nephroselmis olivacea]Q9TKY4.1 RecName: Full=Photosystem II reaction center protein J; Short=PSII-J [Nephroselmis olivacea]AAD54832.1 J protein of photosystem II [Nephroselmis olivacea]
MSNTGTTGRVPLWFVGMIVGLAALGLLGIFFYGSYTGLGSSL